MIRIFFILLVFQLASSEILYPPIVPAYSTILIPSIDKATSQQTFKVSVVPTSGGAAFQKPLITPLFSYIITSGQSKEVKSQQQDPSVSVSLQSSCSQKQHILPVPPVYPESYSDKPVDIKSEDKVEYDESSGSNAIILNNKGSIIYPPKSISRVGEQIGIVGQRRGSEGVSQKKRAYLLKQPQIISKTVQTKEQNDVVLPSTDQQVITAETSNNQPLQTSYQLPNEANQKVIISDSNVQTKNGPTEIGISLSQQHPIEKSGLTVESGIIPKQNEMVGRNNIIGGECNHGEGDNNLILGCKNLVCGDGNLMSGHKNAVSGCCNKISGSGNFVVGCDNAVTTTLPAAECKGADCKSGGNELV